MHFREAHPMIEPSCSQHPAPAGGRPASPRVAIILVNWNNKADTLDCLRSLGSVTYPACEAIVIDNGSTDGSAAAIREAYPGIVMIEAGKNLGFTGGNNIGMRKALEAGADYVLLLNNDTVVDPSFLDALVEVAESDPIIGVVGPKIYYFREPKKIWFLGGRINYWSGEAGAIGKNEADDGKYDKPEDTDLINGCAMLVKREVLEAVGLLYEPMFCYLEENDFCARVKKHGYRLMYVPGAVIWHKVAASASTIKDFQLFYFTRNRIIFMRRNANPLQLLFFLPYYTITFVLVKLALALCQLKWSQARLIMRAFYEGLTI